MISKFKHYLFFFSLITHLVLLNQNWSSLLSCMHMVEHFAPKFISNIARMLSKLKHLMQLRNNWTFIFNNYWICFNILFTFLSFYISKISVFDPQHAKNKAYQVRVLLAYWRFCTINMLFFESWWRIGYATRVFLYVQNTSVFKY